MKSPAFRLFMVLYALFFSGLLVVVLLTDQAELHLDLTLDYLAACSPDFVAAQDVFFRNITELGSWIPFAAAAVLLFRKLGDALLILLSQATLGILVKIFKEIANEPRPKLFFAENFPSVELHQVEGVAMHSANSFPSGHTAAVFSFMLCLVLIFNRKTFLAPVFFLLAVLTAYSRIYLSQHFAEDILAGSLIGVASTILVYQLSGKKTFSWANQSVQELIRKARR